MISQEERPPYRMARKRRLACNCCPHRWTALIILQVYPDYNCPDIDELRPERNLETR